MAWTDVITKLTAIKKDLEAEQDKLDSQGKPTVDQWHTIEDLKMQIESLVMRIEHKATEIRELTAEEQRLEEVQKITASDDFKKTVNRDKDGKITNVIFESAKLDKKATMIPDERDVLKKYTLLTLSAEG